MVGSAQHGGYVRAKHNWIVPSSPLDIDLEAARQTVETAIRLPKQSSGNERDKMIHRDFQAGLASETHHTHDSLTLILRIERISRPRSVPSVVSRWH